MKFEKNDIYVFLILVCKDKTDILNKFLAYEKYNKIKSCHKFHH